MRTVKTYAKGTPFYNASIRLRDVCARQCQTWARRDLEPFQNPDNLGQRLYKHTQLKSKALNFIFQKSDSEL
jgi:hypothetical protein